MNTLILLICLQLRPSAHGAHDTYMKSLFWPNFTQIIIVPSFDKWANVRVLIDRQDWCILLSIFKHAKFEENLLKTFKAIAEVWQQHWKPCICQSSSALTKINVFFIVFHVIMSDDWGCVFAWRTSYIQAISISVN